MTETPSITVHGANGAPIAGAANSSWASTKSPTIGWTSSRTKPARATCSKKNNGKRISPTIKFADGSILVEPPNAELAAKLGLKTTGQRSPYDLIPWHRPPGHVIIGGGPAGLTAARYTAREGIDTLVIERTVLGGQAAAQ